MTEPVNNAAAQQQTATETPKAEGRVPFSTKLAVADILGTEMPKPSPKPKLTASTPAPEPAPQDDVLVDDPDTDESNDDPANETTDDTTSNGNSANDQPGSDNNNDDVTVDLDTLVPGPEDLSSSQVTQGQLTPEQTRLAKENEELKARLAAVEAEKTKKEVTEAPDYLDAMLKLSPEEIVRNFKVRGENNEEKEIDGYLAKALAIAFSTHVNKVLMPYLPILKNIQAQNEINGHIADLHKRNPGLQQREGDILSLINKKYSKGIPEGLDRLRLVEETWKRVNAAEKAQAAELKARQTRIVTTRAAAGTAPAGSGKPAPKPKAYVTALAESIMSGK